MNEQTYIYVRLILLCPIIQHLEVIRFAFCCTVIQLYSPRILLYEEFVHFIVMQMKPKNIIYREEIRSVHGNRCECRLRRKLST